MALTQQEVERRIVAKIGDVTDFSKFEYVTSHTPSIFICKICGDERNVNPSDLYFHGSGCGSCAGRLTQQEVEKRIIKALGDVTDFSKFEYKGSNKPAIFICKTCGHERKTEPASLYYEKKPRGCPSCAEYGFNPNKPAYIYLYKRGQYLKFGITNNAPEDRMKQSTAGVYAKMLHFRYFENGQDALDVENAIKADSRLDVGIAKKNGHEFEGYTETVTDTDENGTIILNHIIS